MTRALLPRAFVGFVALILFGLVVVACSDGVTTRGMIAAPTSTTARSGPPSTSSPPATTSAPRPPTHAKPKPPARHVTPATTRRPTSSAPPPPPVTTRPAPKPSHPAPPPAPKASNCDPAYPTVCLHDGIGDYDCSSGSGNGPNYVHGPLDVRPPDPFRLDSDHDGTGCEKG